ncbi:hypothetical protein BV96_04671 [Sphingomonas paucimobilis]|nr:hypothetical protein BV96_04671 [Sphingomonas paucimobilis]
MIVSEPPPGSLIDQRLQKEIVGGEWHTYLHKKDGEVSGTVAVYIAKQYHISCIRHLDEFACLVREVRSAEEEFLVAGLTSVRVDLVKVNLIF